jgi:hypothetical protein
MLTTYVKKSISPQRYDDLVSEVVNRNIVLYPGDTVVVP